MLSNANALMELSSEVAEEFNNNKLVVVHVPSTDNSYEWINVICQSVHARYDGIHEYRPQYEWNGEVGFKSYLCDLLGCDEANDWESILDGGGLASPIFIVLRAESVRDKAIEEFYQLAHTYQAWDRGRYSRKIILLLHDVDEIPEWVRGPGVRYFQLWNVMTWEEMRTLANQLVSKNENQYLRGWQISTYTGAANLDPFMLNEITLSAPDSLYEINDFVREHCIDTKSVLSKSARHNKYSGKWKVPIELEKSWLSGDVLGSSLERGLNVSWSRVASIDRERMLFQSIWREQMTTLFPLIAEVSDVVADKITDSIGSENWKVIADNHEYGYFTEPSVIIDVFANPVNKLPRIETALWNLLHVLRRMRNQLAHRNCVDSSNMRTLWSMVSILN